MKYIFLLLVLLLQSCVVNKHNKSVNIAIIKYNNPQIESIIENVLKTNSNISIKKHLYSSGLILPKNTDIIIDTNIDTLESDIILNYKDIPIITLSNNYTNKRNNIFFFGQNNFNNGVVELLKLYAKKQYKDFILIYKSELSHNNDALKELFEYTNIIKINKIFYSEQDQKPIVEKKVKSDNNINSFSSRDNSINVTKVLFTEEDNISNAIMLKEINNLINDFNESDEYYKKIILYIEPDLLKQNYVKKYIELHNINRKSIIITNNLVHNNSQSDLNINLIFTGIKDRTSLYPSFNQYLAHELGVIISNNIGYSFNRNLFLYRLSNISNIDFFTGNITVSNNIMYRKYKIFEIQPTM